MSWNYRIIRKQKKNPLKGKGQKIMLFWYDVHEVYYNKKGVPDGWTADPIALKGFDSLKDLRVSLAMMLKDAIEWPVQRISRKGKNKMILVNLEGRVGKLKR